MGFFLRNFLRNFYRKFVGKKSQKMFENFDHFLRFFPDKFSIKISEKISEKKSQNFQKYVSIDQKNIFWKSWKFFWTYRMTGGAEGIKPLAIYRCNILGKKSDAPKYNTHNGRNLNSLTLTIIWLSCMAPCPCEVQPYGTRTRGHTPAPRTTELQKPLEDFSKTHVFCKRWTISNPVSGAHRAGGGVHHLGCYEFDSETVLSTQFHKKSVFF